MAFDNLEALVDVFLHILVVDEVLLELLCQLRAESLDILDLLADLAANLDYLFIYVAGEEMGSFRRIVGRILYVLNKFLNSLVRDVLNTTDLCHDVLNQVLNQRLGLFVCGETGVDLHAYHLTQLL